MTVLKLLLPTIGEYGGDGTPTIGEWKINSLAKK
jgi:hypothetical protein